MTTLGEALRRVAPEQVEAIAREIALVEEVLGANVASQVPLVEEVGRHTLESGGKRLRPALVSLSAAATGREYDPPRARRLGACMEMIHMATLIHDDVIDHAPTRRGRPTAASVFGNTSSILSGDVLLSKAMAILAEDGDIGIIRCVANAVVQMAEGEVLELSCRGDFELSEDAHLNILRMKTGVLIEACCRVGAMVAGADEEEIEALGRFGHHLGIAFQIVDDLLDYEGDQRELGKERATDFREGCATLPLIHLRCHLNSDETELTKGKFGNGVTDDEIRALCDWMGTRGAFDRTRASAKWHADQAAASLASLPENPQRDLLAAVADLVVTRRA